MAGLKDASTLPLIDLPLVRYTIHPYGQEVDAWPPALDERLQEGCGISAWEVWCEATTMRRSR